MSEPWFSGQEQKYVNECLESGWVSTSGPFVQRFEEKLSHYLGVKNAVALGSGTSALHLALLAAGVKPGDEVIVSDLTFIAPANAIRYLDAYPVFIDVSKDDWQMDPELLADFIENQCKTVDGELVNQKSGRRVSAVLPVHILGHIADMMSIIEVLKNTNLLIVEDATEALGAFYESRAAGTFGDFGCFSFNGNKTITSGAGGAVVAKDNDGLERVRYLATQAKDDAREYVHHEIGYNYKMPALSAALGLGQLEYLDERLSRKHRIAAWYEEIISNYSGLEFMPYRAIEDHAFWLSAVRVSGSDSRSLMHAFAAAGIETRVLWQPMHLSPAHAGAQSVGGEISEMLYREVLCLPSSCGLSVDQQEQIEAVLSTFFD